MPREREEYLGDGVYASFDGWHIVLDTRAQEPVNVIYLEPEVWQRLVAYQARLVAKETPDGTDNG